jgi:hypothetical protein
MQNVLENKYEDDTHQVFKPSVLDMITRSEYSTKRPKKIFNKTMKGFNSDMNIPSLKENFKRVAYQKVIEHEQEPVLKSTAHLEK